jgi:hypothetical protein
MLDLDAFSENWLSDFRLAAHWKLDETEGMVARDSAGDSDGILQGDPLWQPSGGKIHGALEFDGTGDYFSTPLVLNPADGPFSIYAWVKGEAPGQAIVSQANGSGETWLGTEPLSGRLLTNLVPPPAGRLVPLPLVSESVITDGRWHHVGLVWDGSLRYLYVDETEVARDDGPLNSLASSKGGLYIGAGEDLDPTGFWSGLIDEIRIYDQAVAP